jgi:hypothetical protein
MTITEPATMLTDYVLAALLLVWGVRLWNARRRGKLKATSWWAGGFLATAIGAIVAGTVHGFRANMDPPTAAALWKASVYSVGLASWLMLSAALFATVARPLQSYLLGVAAAKFLFFAVWMASHTDFLFVIVDYAISLAGILALQVRGCFGGCAGSARWIMGGIVIAGLGAAVQIGRVSLHPQFNHNDLFHVVQMVGFYFFFRGGIAWAQPAPRVGQGRFSTSHGGSHLRDAGVGMFADTAVRAPEIQEKARDGGENVQPQHTANLRHVEEKD